MSNKSIQYTPVQGKTYSLFAEGDAGEGYFTAIKCLTDEFLQRCPDEKRLLSLIQKAGKRRYLSGLTTTKTDRQTLQFVEETLRKVLSIYTQKVSNHLQTLPLTKRTDPVLTTTEKQ